MKNVKTSNIVLAIIFLVLTIFTIAMITTFNRVGAVPDILVTCVFGACLGECSILGVIKTTKTKYGDTEEPTYTDDEEE